jgi:hypothetical protein
MKKDRMYFDKIVVHGGTSHWDDFVSTCLVLAVNPEATIDRRAATGEDGLNPYICVLDQGGDYNPELGNFDHHQFGYGVSQQAIPEDIVAKAKTTYLCSIHLILNELGLLEEAASSMPWLQITGMMDNSGPEKTANFLGITPKTLFAISGDFNRFILKKFETDTESLRTLMIMFGNSIISNVNFRSERIALLKTKELQEGGQYWFLDLRGLDNPFVFAKEAHPKVDFMIGDNSRSGEGVVLRSYVDTTGPDFRVWSDHPTVKFVHANGFLCVLKVGVDPLEWIVNTMM